MDTQDGSMRQPQQDAPPPATRGRGGRGGGGGVPRHYMGLPEDGLFHPLPQQGPQRRTLLEHPVPPQKFTFHNTRVQDMAQPRHDMRSHLHSPMKDAMSSRRGGYIPSSPVGWGGEEGVQRMETSSLETDASHSLEQRDPRLKRKQQPPQVPPHPPQAPQVTMATTTTKRKQDIHLIVHQILSEHSYCKGGGSENEPELEKVRCEQAIKSTASCFLSINRGGIPSVSKLLSSARRRWRPRSKPVGKSVNGKGVVDDKSKMKSFSVADAQVDPLSPVLSVHRFCSSHLEEMSKFYCMSCGEWICRKCVESSGSHHGHNYGTLQLGRGKNSLFMKMEPQPDNIPRSHHAGVQEAKVAESSGDIKEVSQKPKIKLGGTYEEKLDAKEFCPESVRLHAEPFVGVKRPHSALEVSSEPAKFVPPEASKTGPPEFFKQSTPLHTKEVEEEEAEDDFVAMGNFDLDIDSDGFSSSDEVIDHSPAEAIAVKSQEDCQQSEPSYIISLPTTRSHASAKPLPDSPVAEKTSDASYGVSTRASAQHSSVPAADESEVPGDTISEPRLDNGADGGSTSAANADEVDSDDAVPVMVEAAESLRRLGSSSKNSANQAVAKGGPTSQWSITNFDPRKNLIRISKVDLHPTGVSQEAYGQLFSKRLALYASNSSPSGSSVAESCELSEDAPISGDGELNTPSLSSLDSDASSLSSLLSEERGRGRRRGRGTRGRGRRHSRKCTQISTRRTRAVLVSSP